MPIYECMPVVARSFKIPYGGSHLNSIKLDLCDPDVIEKFYA